MGLLLDNWMDEIKIVKLIQFDLLVVYCIVFASFMKHCRVQRFVPVVDKRQVKCFIYF